MARLDQLVARNLGCSRSEARRLLGRRARDLPDERSAPGLPMRLELEGLTVELYQEFHLLLNKPAGCVTALQDTEHPTALSYLRGAPLRAELRPVGRLDLDSTGLLLWTSDGDLVHRLTHPRAAVRRAYQVALARDFSPLPADLVLRDGHRPKVVDLRTIGEGELHPSLLRPPEAATFASITLTEGAYHEVRRIFAALGSHVLSLCRVGYGEVELPRDLAPGAWLPLERVCAPGGFPLARGGSG